MHEAALVDGLMNILTRQAALHGFDHIRRVHLKVGKLRAVEPHALIACFEIFAEGTLAAGADLAIEQVPVRALCRRCGTETTIQRFRFRCGSCDGDDLMITAGEELYIERIDV